MRIHEITLRNYRGVRERTVKFAESGVTIVEGENEAGKSSLIEGLFLLLDYLDSSGHRDVKAVRPAGTGEDPEVSAKFSVGEFAMAYGKRWGRTASGRQTRLAVSGPRREQLTGQQAHDRVRELLDQHVDQQLWRALRLQQGVELKQGQQVTPSLGAALDAAAGNDGEADAHGPLIDRIGDAYAAFYTETGREKAPMTDARKRCDEAEAHAESLRQALAAMEKDAERHVVAEGQLRSLREKREHNERRLEDLRGDWTRIETQQGLVRDLEREASRAAERVEAASAELAQRRLLSERVASAEDGVASAKAALASVEPDHGRAQLKQRDADEAHRHATAMAGRARALHDLRSADERHWNDRLFLEQMSERLERVKRNEESVAAALELLDRIDIDASRVQHIERLQLEAVQAQARAEAETPVLNVRALAALAVSTATDTRRLGTGESAEFDAGPSDSFRIGELAEVSVRSGRGAAGLLAAARDARAAYEDACKRVGAVDVVSARGLLDERRQAEKLLDEAQKGLRQDLRDLTPQTLAERIERLKTSTAEYLKQRAALPPLPESLDEAKRARREAEEALEAALRAAEEAAGALEEARTAVSETLAANEAAKLHVANAEGGLALAIATLDEARNEKSDESLQTARQEAAETAAQARRTLGDAEDVLRSANPDSVQAELGNCDLLRKRLDAEIRDLEQEQVRIDATLALRGEEGLADRVAEAETEAYRRRQEWESIERRAAAAKLLTSVFMRHRDEARKAYVRPFKERLESLGRIVFGADFAVDLSDDLKVEQRTLQGVTVPYESLSTGAKEQIGVLSRLACAALVSADGGVPLILDDALGWSDPGRLEKLGAAFNVGAKDCQVIVLTCTPDRYRGIGSAKVERIARGE